MSEPHEAPPQMAPTRGSVIAYLNLDGALKAAELYKAALGAELAFAYPPDEQGRTMHVHLYLNGGSVFIGDFYPEHGHMKEAPAAFTMQLIVDDAQAWFDRAVAAGFQPAMPVQKMFWGDTWGSTKDPFGVVWAFNQPSA